MPMFHLLLKSIVSHSQPKMLNRVLASPIAKTNMLLLYKKAIFIAFYNHLCACQLSQHDLAVRIAFPHDRITYGSTTLGQRLRDRP